MNKLFLKSKSGTGFTLVELLVVVGCISILVALAAPSYALMQKNIGLSNAAQEVVNVLRTAQNNAISAQDGVNFGVRFEQHQYILCRENCTVDITTFPLNNGIEIIPEPGASLPLTFNFTRLTGTATFTPLPPTCTPITCQVKVGFPDKQKTIQVEAVGRISITQ